MEILKTPKMAMMLYISIRNLITFLMLEDKYSNSLENVL